MIFDKTRDCKNCYHHLVCGVYNPNFDNYAPECNFYMGKDDYEKVVRCKDCWKRYKHCFDKTLEDDDFCSYGERKE